MSDRSKMSSPTTSAATFNAISSPESAAGHSPFSSRDGTQAELFGPGPVPANLSALRENGADTRTHDTSGPPGSASSASVGLQSCLASRLREVLAGRGSPLYGLTWKAQAMPWGPPICRLVGSVRRTNGSGCGSWESWPTPQARADSRSEGGRESRAAHQSMLMHAAELAAWPTPDGAVLNVGSDVETHMRRLAKLKEKAKNGNGAGLTLGMASQLAAWQTPKTPTGGGQEVRTTKGGGLRKLEDQAQMAAWPTPRGEDVESAGMWHGRGVADTLTAQTTMAAWSTPSSRDWKDTPGMAETGRNPDGSNRTRLDQLPRQTTLVRGTPSSGFPAATGKRGQLAPSFSAWLQGYPPEWCLAAIKIPKRRQKGR